MSIVCGNLVVINHDKSASNNFFETMEEAILLASPSRLRHLFATLCIISECTPDVIPNVWSRFKRYFVEDLFRRNPSGTYRDSIFVAVEKINAIMQRIKNDSTISLESLGCSLFNNESDLEIEQLIREELNIIVNNGANDDNDNDDAASDISDVALQRNFIVNFNINTFSVEQLTTN